MTATSLHDLPNELILHVFALFPTSTLLSLTPVSHRFHHLVLRLLQARLLQAAELPDHTLLLECHHPSQKYTEAPLHCPYLGTPVLENREIGIDGSVGSLSILRGIYSSYQPRRRRPDVPVRKRPGDIPGSRTHQETSPQPESSSPISGSISSNGPILEPDTVKQIISLEDHELFSQLCATVNLVRNGPRMGLFRSFVSMNDESVVRVWKNWLGRRAVVDSSSSLPSADTIDFGISYDDTSILLPPCKGRNDKSVANSIQDGIAEDESILWFDLHKHIGLRVNVRETKWAGDPMMLLTNADEAVSYEVEYKEMIVRTSHLLLFMEQSLKQQDNTTGKAVVFGSWDI
ncbi:hypothetical protein FKW77_010387 [Venturia effusa]|uniref:F-box domain-containing protein n=1 Tax=Venturia effusa TaxID=50376 RepID=A0A517L2D3_9PEZI|nr:hypothetical protein FKW77_010387 [Venturia effusa]